MILYTLPINNLHAYLNLWQTLQVKQSHYRPGQDLSVPRGWGSQISRQSAHEGSKVVSPTYRPPLPPRKYCWYSFLLEAESTPEPQCGRKDYVNKKIPVTSSGIETATFRLVAQCLNQLPYCVPPGKSSAILFCDTQNCPYRTLRVRIINRVV